MKDFGAEQPFVAAEKVGIVGSIGIRPTSAVMQTDEVCKLHCSSLTKSEIARRLNIDRTSVRRILAALATKK